MNPLSKLSTAISVFREGGIDKLSGATRKFLLESAGNVYLPGEPVFEYEWDVLVVLDACRSDLLEEFADEYEFLEDVQTINSVASKTPEWVTRTFTEEYHDQMQQLAYIMGNPNSGRFLSSESFSTLDEVWRYAWDEELGMIPPRPVTDRAIETYRSDSANRMMVHYMQPHQPFLSNPELGGRSTTDRIVEGNRGDLTSVWTRLERGEIDEDTVWEAYRENLRSVLDDVRLLLNSIDAERVVITADHGNALGELGVYGHPAHVPLKCLRRVPWVVTEAKDDGTYDPTTERSHGSEGVESKLEQLGYL